MARIAGVNLPVQKHTWVALTSIYGIGRTRALQICEAAKVKKGSFYHFFPSKRDLALATIEAQWGNVRAELMDPAFATDAPPLERIGRFFTMTCAYQEASRDENGQIRGCPFGNLAIELSAHEKAIREELENIYSQMAGYIERALAEYSPASDLRAGADELLAFHQGAVLLAKTRNDPTLIAAMAGTAVKLGNSIAEIT